MLGDETVEVGQRRLLDRGDEFPKGGFGRLELGRRVTRQPLEARLGGLMPADGDQGLVGPIRPALGERLPPDRPG